MGNVQQDIRDVDRDARTYYEKLLEDVLSVLDANSVMVIGPLSVETEQLDQNIVTMHATQKDVAAATQSHVFDQTKYLDIYSPDAPRRYDLKFDIFYKGIIKSGKIRTLYVMPGSENARGAQTEISYAREHGIPLVYLK